jgi:hypothetical protein
MPGFDFGEIQKVVNQSCQLLAVALDGLNKEFAVFER